MNNTSAVAVSIQAVSPELILLALTIIGAAAGGSAGVAAEVVAAAVAVVAVVNAFTGAVVDIGEEGIAAGDVAEFVAGLEAEFAAAFAVGV